MIEDKGSLLKRFGVWFANLIGGKDYAWEMDHLRDAIEGWRKENAALKQQLDKIGELHNKAMAENAALRRELNRICYMEDEDEREYTIRELRTSALLTAEEPCSK